MGITTAKRKQVGGLVPQCHNAVCSIVHHAFHSQRLKNIKAYIPVPTGTERD